MSDLSFRQTIHDLLKNLNGVEPLKRLFWTELNYKRENQTLSRRGWPGSTAAFLADDPLLFASGGEGDAFHVLYCRLPDEGRLLLTKERPVVNRLLKDHLDALFIFSDKTQTHWHFVNVRDAKGKAQSERRVLRRISIVPNTGLRTATERISLLDLNRIQPDMFGIPVLEIQKLHNEAFDVEKVTKDFYREIANWYFWALKHIRFPKDATKEKDGLDHISVIRLITRLIFCWFIKEKGLIPDPLFKRSELRRILVGFEPSNPANCGSVFYRAILQNLFFATLNTEMNKREWTREKQNYMAHNLYRFKEAFNDPATALDLFRDIPFLNGGLFECLDKDLDEGGASRELRIDGFSRNQTKQVTAPDFLFFGPEQEVDLSADYGDKKFRKTRVRGLIETLDRYKFTIEENTPLDQEVALDPELCGKVFENLLAAYNPETGTTARKATGSFYTPREIVDYMVDEALIAFLKNGNDDTYEKKLRDLFSWEKEGHGFTEDETQALIDRIDSLKALDPAVGSGAFPMGILHKLVFILGKLDPGNERWKAKQIAKLDDVVMREEAERVFRENYDNYGRKLYLIENCIYGVDIQPIAVQIAKMRFFISLIVDQKVNDSADNRGVRALPNLETKFVAANTLFGIEKPKQLLLRNLAIDAKESELRRVREKHFNARTPKTKDKCRELDKQLRAEIAGLLEKDGWEHQTAKQLSDWDPYNQNVSADFFDPEWMFGVHDGFNVVIGNPPWGQKAISLRESERKYIQQTYSSTAGIFDIFRPFVEKGIRLLKNKGAFAMILPDIVLLKDYQETRQEILDKLTIKVIDWWGMAFESAIIDTATIIGTKSPCLNEHRIVVSVHDSESPLNHEIPQMDFWSNPRLVFNLYLTPDKREILCELSTCPKLGQFFEIHEGVHSGNMRSELFVDYEVDKTCRKLLFGRDEIKPFHLTWNGKFIRLGAAPTKRTEVSYANLGRQEWYDRDKILIRRTGDYVLAACDFKKRYACNNFFIVFEKVKCSLNLQGLCALLNSNFMTWYFRTIEPRQGRVFAELKIKHIESFPLPSQVINPDGCKMINELGEKRTKMAELLAETNSLQISDKTIEKLDEEIDTLVAEMFQIPSVTWKE